MTWLLNILLMSRSPSVMSLEETRVSSFISCGKTGEEEPASGTQTPTCLPLGRDPWGHHGSVYCQNLLPSSGRPGMAGVPTVLMGPVWRPVPSCCRQGGDWVLPWVGGDRGSAKVGGDMGVLCPRLRIRETTKELTPMQTHKGWFPNSSLRPSTPDTAEQGLGPRGGF